MAPLTSSTTNALRVCTRQRLPAISTSSVALQRRGHADAKASFESPFSKADTTKIPSWGKYKSSNGEVANRVFQYFMAGTFGALAAAGAKNTVQGGFLGLQSSIDL
jgi:ubiquinol-cytochrome c reductase iron-sulfur subunit